VVAYRGCKLSPGAGARSSDSLRESLTLTNSSRFLVASHDAGGAEVIADFVPVLGAETRFVTAGPARSIFDKVLPVRTEVSVEEGLAWADTVIVATGWQTDLEISTQAKAQSRGLRTAAVLDNWDIFDERFNRHGYHIEPAELWVVDKLAARKAEGFFPGALIKILPWNHYDLVVEAIVEARSNRTEPVDGGFRVLFLGENVQGFEATLNQRQPFGFSQFDALAYVDRVLNGRNVRGLDIRIRPHPSENPCRYRDAIVDLKNAANVSDLDLVADLAWCDIAVGISSIALYYANHALIPTGTCYPVPVSNYHSSPWDLPTLEALLDQTGWPDPRRVPELQKDKLEFDL